MVFDLAIVGAGSAGLSASIYSSRYKLNHLVFGEKMGGQILDAHIVENYPGFTSITGMDLATKFVDHAESYGVEVLSDSVTTIKRVNGGDSAAEQVFEITTKSGKIYSSKSIILAMGARHRSLNIPGEEMYLGKGVSYCATCDAPLFKGKMVAVVGGGDSALTAGLLLSEYAEKVYLIHRGDSYKAEPVWVDKVRATKNIIPIMLNTVIKVIGKKEMTASENGGSQDSVGGIELQSEFEGNKLLNVDGVFIEIGLMPAVSLATALGVELFEQSSIKIDSSGRTNIPGVFAAGDLCRIPGAVVLRQIITSASQGAVASAAVYEYLHKKGPVPNWGGATKS